MIEGFLGGVIGGYEFDAVDCNCSRGHDLRVGGLLDVEFKVVEGFVGEEQGIPGCHGLSFRWVWK